MMDACINSIMSYLALIISTKDWMEMIGRANKIFCEPQRCGGERVVSMTNYVPAGLWYSVES